MSDFKEALRETMAELNAGGSDGATDSVGAVASGGAEQSVPGVHSDPAAPVESMETAGEGKEESVGDAAARARDDKGRFAPKAGDKQGLAKAVETKTGKPSVASAAEKAGPPGGVHQQGAPALTPAAEQPPASPAPEFKAPQSWKGPARELLAKAPAEVQQEVLRREREITTALQEAAPDRKLAQEFRQTVAPHEQTLRAQGLDPVKEFGGFLNFRHTLAYGTPAQKAQLAAQVIRSFNVDIDSLAGALEGHAPAQQAQQQAIDPNQIAQQVQQQVMQAFQNQQAERIRQQAAQQVEAFGENQPFWEDLKPTVGALLTAAHQRGVALSLEDAYKQASWAHPEARKALMQREAAERAKADAASTQQAISKAKNAASSVKSQPAAEAKSKPGSFREALAAEFRAARENGG